MILLIIILHLEIFTTQSNLQKTMIRFKRYELNVFLNTLIDNSYYKKDNRINFLIYDLIEFYFTKLNTPASKDIYEKYNYFMQRILNTKKFNLDEESLFIEFKHKILNG